MGDSTANTVTDSVDPPSKQTAKPTTRRRTRSRKGTRPPRDASTDQSPTGTNPAPTETAAKTTAANEASGNTAAAAEKSNPKSQSGTRRRSKRQPAGRRKTTTKRSGPDRTGRDKPAKDKTGQPDPAADQPTPADLPAATDTPAATRPARAAASAPAEVDQPAAKPRSREPFGVGLTIDPATRAANLLANDRTAASPTPATGNVADADGSQGESTATDSDRPKRTRGRRSGSRKPRSSRATEAQTGDADQAGRGAPATDEHRAPVETEEPPVDASPTAASTDSSPSEGDASDEQGGTGRRLVLKPRPRRRAGSAQRSRRGGAGDDKDKSGSDASPKSEEKAVSEKKTASSRSRRTKKKSKPAKIATIDEADEAEFDETESEKGAERKSGVHVIAALTEQDGPQTPLKTGREIIFNVTAGAECRVAILQDGRLEELFIERTSAVSHVGNIYLGRVTNVEPSIQAAFIDFGLNKNGFLHISDVLPKYFPDKPRELEPVGKKVPRKDRPPIQKCFRRGDRVLVQVVKEGVGTKGPTLTTYLSIPGRYMVMMPGMNKLGVSRKIEDDSDRRSMRDVLTQLSLPEGMGFILRTAGLNRTKRELQSDLNYLQRLWKTVKARMQSEQAPCELYQESDLVIRTIRDVYSSDFKRIIVDDKSTANKALDFLSIALPRTPATIYEYSRPEPLFHFFGIEEEIKRIHSRHVPLPSGGSIIIESTEAMVTIDVNSGKFRDLQDAEETAFRIDVEAAEEIARQLRLRDLGGLVVCDFIDLRLDRHKRAVEKALRDALKKHKERARILRMSKFGLIEMTRQRQRQSIRRSIFVDCPHCSGSGLIKTPESMSLEAIRIIQLMAHREEVHRVTVVVAPAVATILLNDRRAFLHELEQRSAKVITIVPDPTYSHDQINFDCIDPRGMPLRIDI